MRAQRVVMPDGSESWTLLEGTGDVVAPVEAYLAHLQAMDRSPTTARTDATSVKFWFEFLCIVEVHWDGARATDHATLRRTTAQPTGKQGYGLL